jgi:predicted ATPase
MLENFKIFSKVKIKPNKITVLIGPNSTGKSTIAQALLLLKQSTGQQLELKGAYADLGSFTDIQHSDGKQIKIGFSGDKFINVRKPRKKSIQELLDFRIIAGFSGPSLSELKCEMWLSNEFIELEIKDRKLITPEQTINWGEGKLLINGVLNLDNPIVLSGFTGTQNTEQQNEGTRIVNLMSTAPRSILNNLEFVPANRGFSLPGYPLENDAKDHFEIGMPMNYYETQVATTFAYRRDKLEPVINNWMKDITGIKVKAPVGEGRKVQITSRQAKGKMFKDVKIAFEGFGSNQLLFILIPLAQSEDGSILVVEEPELHLHPKAQAALTRLLLKESISRKNQLFLTTQSEHVIASLLTEIAGDTLSNDDVAIYSFSRRGDNAYAKLLKLDSRGRVQGGLPGFFDASIEEAERHIKALERKS